MTALKRPAMENDPDDEGATPFLEANETRSAGASSTPGGASGQGQFSLPSPVTGAIPQYHSFGERYEILELLGEGGMGRVYKAWDRELERVIALKTIRSDQAENEQLLKRFKQELLLAQKITHKNVIRIHDMGDSQGVKFFTMEYIPGQSLKAFIGKRGKIEAEEALPLTRQILSALGEAHRQGVVHRDLKPQNIMIDTEGVPRIMDFGIAKSAHDNDGMTATGVMMGTPDYVSPEQARGQNADAQSDLFSLGVILYEMLTGELPYRGDSLAVRVLARLSEKPKPPRQLNPELPPYLENIVLKCMEVDRELRYPSAEAVLEDLERESVDRSPLRRLQRAALRHRWLTAALAALVLASGAAIHFALRSGSPPALVASRTLAILPFANATSDPSLDWLGSSLAEILTTEVGQSSSLRAVSSDRVHQILRDLRIAPGSRFDPPAIARLATFSDAELVIAGQYLKLGETIRVDASLHDVAEQRTVPLKVEAASEEALLAAISELAQSVQENLGLSRDRLQELRASGFRPSSDSIAALRLYNEASQLSRQGRDLEALERLREAVQEDPGFALAYSKLGQTFAGLGYDAEARDALERAVELSADLPDPERYLILATRARIEKNYEEAIASYRRLAEVMPAEPEVQFNLGSLYEEMGDMEQARGYFREVLDRDPNDVAALYARGRVEIRSGNPQAALEHLNRALSLAVQLDNTEARGTLLNAVGVAYRLMGRPEEASRNYQEALAMRQKVGDKRGQAATLREIATMHQSSGEVEEASRSLQQALALQRSIGDQSGEGDTLNALGYLEQRRGNGKEALGLFKDALRIHREVGNERDQAMCLNNIGNVYLDQGELGDAQTHFELALPLREKGDNDIELAETVHNLGEVAARTGRYVRALDYYLRAASLSRGADDKEGTAIELYSMGTIFAYQGRFGAALEATAEAVAILRELQERGFWMAEVLSGYGRALNEVGRHREAAENLEQALGLARELRNRTQIAQILGYQADGLLFQGETSGARAGYQEAMTAAQEDGHRQLELRNRLRVAQIDGSEGRDLPGVTPILSEITEEADRLGLKYLSTDAAIARSALLLKAGNVAQAREDLRSALRTSERLGLLLQQAKAHHHLAHLEVEEGNEPEASRHRSEKTRILEAMAEEGKSEALLQRNDLAPMVAPAR